MEPPFCFGYGRSPFVANARDRGFASVLACNGLGGGWVFGCLWVTCALAVCYTPARDHCLVKYRLGAPPAPSLAPTPMLLEICGEILGGGFRGGFMKLLYFCACFWLRFVVCVNGGVSFVCFVQQIPIIFVCFFTLFDLT